MEISKVFNYIWKNKKRDFISTIILFLVGIFMMISSTTPDNVTETQLVKISVACGASFSSGAIVSLFNMFRIVDDALQNDLIYLPICNSGIVALYNHRDIDEYYTLVKNAKEIDISGYSLRGFWQSHKDTIIQRVESKKLRLRIVVVNPVSDISKNREYLEEGEVSGSFMHSINKIISQLNNKDGVEIYQIDYALSTMIFRIDNVMFVGPHFIKAASKTTYTMKLKKDTWTYNEFNDEFEAMCKKAKRIS